MPAGPSGAPTRGRLDVLPTGRNFYSVDPRSLPSELAYEVGCKLADALLERHVKVSGELPRMVGLVAWGTAAMRTQGDDVAEILALLGVRPTWHPESRRVTGIEVVSLEELGRPRVDVTVRISGFFRDAFPHLVALLDDAVATVAGLDEPDEQNFVAAHARADAERLAAALDGKAAWRRATTRIFGSKPGTYGAGLMQLLETRDWRDDADLAAVHEAWSGYAYGRDLDGVAAADPMRDCYARIDVAAKNVDSGEHDILDSDDYYQYHGAMVATVRAITGAEPAAYLGDSSDPARVVARTLAEETRRVFRARVANPRWIASMIRHGYKGAAELSATIDYLFGYDATAGVAEDWMYEQVAAKYLLDEDVAAFMAQSNPGRRAGSPSGCSRRLSAACGLRPRKRHWTRYASGSLRSKASSRRHSRDAALSAQRDRRPARARRGAAHQRGCARRRRRARPRRARHGEVDGCARARAAAAARVRRGRRELRVRAR